MFNAMTPPNVIYQYRFWQINGPINVWMFLPPQRIHWVYYWSDMCLSAVGTVYWGNRGVKAKKVLWYKSGEAGGLMSFCEGGCLLSVPLFLQLLVVPLFGGVDYALKEEPKQNFWSGFKGYGRISSYFFLSLTLWHWDALTQHSESRLGDIIKPTGWGFSIQDIDSSFPYSHTFHDSHHFIFSQISDELLYCNIHMAIRHSHLLVLHNCVF